MNIIDHLDLDSKSLTTFLTVLEEMSVSRAAERLGVTQSAASQPWHLFFAWALLNDPFGSAAEVSESRSERLLMANSNNSL